MVQRMEEDARRRAETEIQNARAEARRDAQVLIDQAIARANEVAELTRHAVAQVLAEEHAELLTGLAELSALEQRLRTRVLGTSARVEQVIRDPLAANAASAASGAAPDSADAASGEPVVPPPMSAPSVATASAPAAPVVLPPTNAVDFDAPVVGPDEAFFADLRTAVGMSTIAGRGDEARSVAPVAPVAPPVPDVAPRPPVPPVPMAPPATAPGGDQRAAMAAAAAAATAATMAPATAGPTAALSMRSGGGAATATATMPIELPAFTDAPPTQPFLHVVPPTVRPVPDPLATPPAPPQEGPPTGRRARANARRSRWAMLGTGLRNLGILLLLFVVFQLWGTSALEHRDQAKLRHQFQLAIATQTAPSSSVGGDINDPSTVTTPTTVVVPTCGSEWRGSRGHQDSEDRCRAGSRRGNRRERPSERPGPLPQHATAGPAGNAAIAGHRTTYGAPFNRIDELAPGDPILVTTLQGDFKYVVSEPPVAVSPSQNDVLFNKGDNRLTLTTCHPKYSASKRLIVVATLSKHDEAGTGTEEDEVDVEGSVRRGGREHEWRRRRARAGALLGRLGARCVSRNGLVESPMGPPRCVRDRDSHRARAAVPALRAAEQVAPGELLIGTRSGVRAWTVGIVALAVTLVLPGVSAATPTDDLVGRATRIRDALLENG